MLYVLKKEQIEHSRLRALAQAIIAKDKGKEVFDDYMKVAFPWLETQKHREKSDHVAVLMAEVKKGALGIKPMNQELQVRSRLKTRVVAREEQVEAPKPRDMNALYAKLGRVVPI